MKSINKITMISAALLIGISINAVLNDVLMKTLLANGFNPLTVNGFRVFFSCLIAIIFGLRSQGTAVFAHVFSFNHFIRNLVTISAILLVIKGLSECNIAQVDLISYLIPAFISLIATFIFKEKFNKINFGLIAVCLSVFIWRKGLGSAWALIISSLLFAFAEVWIRHKMPNEKIWPMVVSLGITGTILLSYFFIPYLSQLTLFQLFLGVLMGIGDISILTLITYKARIGSSHDCLPLRYSSIGFAVLADKIFFGVNSFDYVFISLIVGCSLISVLFHQDDSILNSSK